MVSRTYTCNDGNRVGAEWATLRWDKELRRVLYPCASLVSKPLHSGGSQSENKPGLIE